MSANERKQVRALVELVPDSDLATLTRLIRGLLATEGDPVLAALDRAPENDEPVSPEESEQVRRGIQEAARGEVIPNATFWRKHA
jgi:hypothetical protein